MTSTAVIIVFAIILFLYLLIFSITKASARPYPEPVEIQSTSDQTLPPITPAELRTQLNDTLGAYQDERAENDSLSRALANTQALLEVRTGEIKRLLRDTQIMDETITAQREQLKQLRAAHAALWAQYHAVDDQLQLRRF